MTTQTGSIGAVLDGTYRIEAKLGHGGMGTVYRATHLRLGQPVAVKVLTAEPARSRRALARFRREAQVTSGLGHPNIVAVLDFNEPADHAPYIVMELLQGEDLRARIERRAPLPLDAVALITRQATSALAAAHAQGVVHRDLKPENVFLCRSPTLVDHVKLLDFGISKVLEPSEERAAQLTAREAVIGSPQYMAPEQARRRSSEVDARADVYSLATVVFEMLTGQRPFAGDSVPEILRAVVFEDAPSLRSKRSTLSPELEEVIAIALAKEPEDRFPTIGAFWRAFAVAVELDVGDGILGTELGIPIEAAPPEPPAPTMSHAERTHVEVAAPTMVDPPDLATIGLVPEDPNDEEPDEDDEPEDDETLPPLLRSRARADVLPLEEERLSVALEKGALERGALERGLEKALPRIGPAAEEQAPTVPFRREAVQAAVPGAVPDGAGGAEGSHRPDDDGLDDPTEPDPPRRRR